MKKKLVPSLFIVFLFAAAVNKCIEKPEIWRIIFVSVGLIVWLFFILSLQKKYLKKKSNS
jgi:hypothetical protein